MMSAPSPTSVGLLLGLSFFLGLAFEDFFAHTGSRRPGGIRTFPMLALAGGVLYSSILHISFHSPADCWCWALG
jgi:hypothetical protein